MSRWTIVLAPVLATAVMASACGGGSTKTIKTDNGNVQVSTSNKVPDSFPSDFPVYGGADVQGSYTGTQSGVTGTVVTWTTGDAVDKVKSFYDDAFKSGKWKSSASGSGGDASYWIGESSDGTKQFYVAASRGSGDDKTSIIATVGDNQSASSDSTPSGSSTSSSDEGSATSTSGGSTQTASDLPPEQSLPSGYPKDRVPLPSGARVTSATTVSSGGANSHYVEAYVKDSPANVSDYFKTELPKHNWTQALASESNGDYFITMTGEGQDGVTVTITASDVPGYAKVDLVVVAAS